MFYPRLSKERSGTLDQFVYFLYKVRGRVLCVQSCVRRAEYVLREIGWGNKASLGLQVLPRVDVAPVFKVEGISQTSALLRDSGKVRKCCPHVDHRGKGGWEDQRGLLPLSCVSCQDSYFWNSVS